LSTRNLRVLGKRGTMNVDLVLGPSLVGTVVPRFDKLLTGFSYLPGSSTKWRSMGWHVIEAGNCKDCNDTPLARFP
jgi:hypothetical protein